MKVIHNLIVTSLASAVQKYSKTPLASVLVKRLRITEISLLSASACAQLKLSSAN